MIFILRLIWWEWLHFQELFFTWQKNCLGLHICMRADLSLDDINFSISDVPNNLRADAVQCVLLLLPDEHREALQTLLEFLCQVSARSACNQMTASNLAVCLAPSVFHLHHTPSSLSSSRSSSASPRRRKTVGVPDQRELGENRAAHDCLLYLIKEHKDLFMVCYFHCLVWVASYIQS